jgi:ubiquinone/menaquinone biosynthesis C-methylase UbiE
MPEPTAGPAPFAPEEERVRAAYARRPTHDARYTWASANHVFNTHERERDVLRLLQREGCLPLTGQTILEVGCGTGAWLREFIKWGARPEDVFGIDLLPERVAEARRLCPAGTGIECGSAAALPFPAARFDIVLQATMFTSILDPALKQRIASEMLRVVKPRGFIVWYDFHVDNPWNPDVRGVTKTEIRALFPGCRADLRRTTLATPLSRWVASRSWLATYVLARLPPLCTHYLGTIRKGDA